MQNDRNASRGIFASLLGVVAVVVTACAPAGAPSTSAPDGKSQPTGPKTVVMAMQGEPGTILSFGRIAGTATPDKERYAIFHASLTSYGFKDEVLPRVAAKVPSISDGDLKVNPDGTMDVTWKIRPGVKWHDGTALTTKDFVFGYQVTIDPKLAVPGLGELAKVSGIRAIDDQTMVISWKTTSFYGNSNGSDNGIPAIAAHQLQPQYEQNDPDAFTGSAGWRSEFIGLGPYRVTNWVLGSQLEAEAFGDYFQGRPKIDRVIIKWIPDVNIILANLLAGSVDLAPSGSMMKVEQGMQLKASWGDAGTFFLTPANVRVLAINERLNQPYSEDKRFRQGMMYSIDRQGIVDTLHYGLTTIVEYYLFPSDPLNDAAIKANLQRYPFDPAKGQQLFAQAGWTKGADGLLHNSAGATVPFVCCRLASSDTNDNRESLAWGDFFKVAGLDVQTPIPAPPAGLSSTDTRKASAFLFGGSIGNWYTTPRSKFATVTSVEISNDANKWQGQNTSAWSSPEYDAIHAKVIGSFNNDERLQLQLQQLRILLDELPLLPVYLSPNITAVRTGLSGVGPVPVQNPVSSWNIETWDIR